VYEIEIFNCKENEAIFAKSKKVRVIISHYGCLLGIAQQCRGMVKRNNKLESIINK
jgi:hypothetical protein